LFLIKGMKAVMILLPIKSYFCLFNTLKSGER
jgi:hypothetical protein